MSDYKVHLSFDKLQKALAALEIAARKPMMQDRINVDATIQRFEFTIELFWKLLKVILESKGVAIQYPKDVLREAFRGKLIDDEKCWLEMLHDRNATSHTYDEEIANKIFNNIKKYIPVIRRTFDALYNEYYLEQP